MGAPDTAPTGASDRRRQTTSWATSASLRADLDKERRLTAVPRAAVDKRALVQIDRTVEREMDPALRPPDAPRKG